MDGISGFDRTMALLKQVLDLHAFRQSVIAANIANIDTPGYQPFDVIYADELRSYIAMGPGGGPARTHPGHLPHGHRDRVVEPVVVTLQGGALGSVAEGVDIDQEMSKLSEVSLLYDAAAQLLAKKLQMLKYTIDGGGGR